MCEAKSGTGKTAVFVISTLHQLDMIDDQVHALVICHTRELALQIGKEFERLGKYMSNVKIAVFFGGMPIQKDEHILLTATPHIVVGTPGRVLSLVRSKQLNLKHLRHFVLDECDKMLEQLGEFRASTGDCLIRVFNYRNAKRCSRNLLQRTE